MKILGIIAEYNPFHNGHLYHLNESRKLIDPDYTVCVMSGYFTQRGEPAMADKWIRAAAAVNNGIDLVIELPFVFACNNAEHFAAGAVDILNRLGCVTHLSFGSESGDLTALQKAAEYLSCENEQYKSGIKEFSGRGVSFPKARYEAVKKYMGESSAEVLKSANNILAVEYLKQIYLTNSSMIPITVKRYGTGYHDKIPFENIASATAIRHKLYQSSDIRKVSEFIPEATFEVLQKINRDDNLILNDFYQLLIYRILTSETDKLGEVLSATEGLEYKVKKAAVRSKDTETLIKAILSKRYTSTRIQRLLMHILVQLEKDGFQNILSRRINYGRVLAFSRQGASLIKRIKKEKWNSIPILTNINRELDESSEEWKLLKYDVSAADIYNLIDLGEIYSRSDYVMKPYHNMAAIRPNDQ